MLTFTIIYDQSPAERSYSIENTMPETFERSCKFSVIESSEKLVICNENSDYIEAYR